MALINSNATGLWSAAGTWVGGVPPVEGDSVVIALGHVVTVDGTYTAGDDTNTAFTVSGTLKASRTVNSSLTVKGLLTISPAATATLDYGRRSIADPIPAGINATLILNKSAAMVTYKYGLFVGDTANAYLCGATKNTNARLTANLAAAGTSVTVNDVTGWLAGDSVVLAASDGTVSHFEKITLLTVTPGTGTTGTITFAAVTYSHGSNCPAGNLTSNVTVKNFDLTTFAFACFRHTSIASNNRREVDYVAFARVGSNTAQVNTQIFVSGSNAVLATPFVTFTHNSFYNCSAVGLFMNVWNSGGFYLDSLAFFNDDGISGTNFYTASGTFVGLKNAVFYYNIGVMVQTSFSQGGQGVLYTDCTFCANIGQFMYNQSNGDGLLFTRCSFHTGASFGMLSLNSGSANFVDCNFGALVGLGSAPSLWGFPANQWCNNMNINAGKWEGSMTGCTFGVFSVALNTFNGGAAVPNPQWKLSVANKNSDVTQQEVHLQSCSMYRDNAVVNRGTSSIRFEADTVNVGSQSVNFLTSSGVPVTVVGYLRKNSTYGATTLPSVSITGLGIAPVTFTMSNSVDTWEKFSLTATQTTGAPGNLTFTFSGQSATSTGKAYLDGVPQSPFIVSVNHYGYTYDPTNPLRNVDPVVLLSETAAAALSGISYAAGTLTVSGTRTIREIYDWLKQYEAANQIAPLITSTDGSNFTLASNLVLSGAITGSGSLFMQGYTLTGAGTSTVVIWHNAGILVLIGLTGVQAGSLVQVYDATSGVELYIGTPGVSLGLNASYVAPHTIRVRVAKLGYLPFLINGGLTASGLTLITAQVADSVYVANAVDGSTVTEFALDVPNVQVDVSDPDGVTTLWRLYAWLQYIQTTNAGIRAVFQSILAQDTVNFQVDQAVVNLQLDNRNTAPVRIIGGYLARKDGSTIIAPLSNSIQMDPAKAYISSSGDVAAAVWNYSG